MWGLEFGAFKERTKFIWKHLTPWHYPAHELPMLKTAVRVMNIAEIVKFQAASTAKADIGKALGISDEQKEKNKTASNSMASFFKELPK